MEVDNFSDRRELLVECGDSEADTGVGSFSLEQGTEHKGEDAVEGMDP